MSAHVSKPQLWDPFRAWPSARWWIWGALAVLACAIQGPTFVKSLRPNWERGVDFFQEWASARNVFHNRPVYMDQTLALESYRTREAGPTQFETHIKRNAHPPSSVVLALPFALLDYPDATLLWNVLSLCLIVLSMIWVLRTLGLGIPILGILPALVLLLTCNPLRQQVNQGQLNGVILFLLTAVWLLDRAERPVGAGLALGLVTAFKLFPGFLFLYFLLRRRWKVVGSGMLSFSLVTMGTATFLGFSAYQDFIKHVLPYTSQFYGWLVNVSLPSFWLKLFDTGAIHAALRIEPLVHAPWVARVLILISSMGLLGSWALQVRRARSRSENDLTFGLSLIVMILISPIAWDHYLLLLLLPIVQVWRTLPQSGWVPIGFLVLLFGLWIKPFDFAPELLRCASSENSAMVTISIDSPGLLLSLGAFPFYAVFLLFLWVSRLLARAPSTRPSDGPLEA